MAENDVFNNIGQSWTLHKPIAFAPFRSYAQCTWSALVLRIFTNSSYLELYYKDVPPTVQVVRRSFDLCTDMLLLLSWCARLVAKRFVTNVRKGRCKAHFLCVPKTTLRDSDWCIPRNRPWNAAQLIYVKRVKGHKTVYMNIGESD